jgi:hypothetical protein
MNQECYVYRLFRIMALVLSILAIGGTISARAQEATPAPLAAAELGYFDLSIKITDAGVELPASIPAGRYLVTLEDATDHGIDAFLFRLPDGVTAEMVDAAFASPPEVAPDWWLDAILAGGPTVQSGRTGQVIADLIPGNWIVIGNGHPTQPFTVTGDPAAPITVTDPTIDAEIALQEYAFIGLDNLKAGQQTWKVTNTGAQPHFMELIKVPAGTTAEQIMQLLMADENATPAPGDVDPSQIEGVGGIGALSSGRTGWYVTNLDSGTYVALCFVLDFQAHMPHAMMGMIQVFTVS